MRSRAAAALEKLASEWIATPTESVKTKDSRDDAEERARAAAKRYRKTSAAKAANLVRMRERCAARRSARQEAALA